MTKNASRRRLARLAPAAALLTLAACVGAPERATEALPLNPLSRYSLQVEPGLDRIALAVRDDGLSPNQRAALGELAVRFALDGAPVIRVEAPAGGDVVAGDMAWRVKDALEAAGVPAHRIQMASYQGPDVRSPVLAGFDTVTAVVPQCGRHWDSMTRTANNQTSPNFGCSVNANLAAQIANPRDIVRPRDMTASDAGRRAVVFSSYRAGQPVSAPQEELLSGQRISRAVE